MAYGKDTKVKIIRRSKNTFLLMKTLQYILMLGLVVPNFALAYDLPGDVVATGNIVSEISDCVVSY